MLILSQILHDWDDERAAAILTNCRRAVRTDGRLLLVEGAIHDGSEPDFLKLLDLHMLVMFGGKERTSRSEVHGSLAGWSRGIGRMLRDLIAEHGGLRGPIAWESVLGGPCRWAAGGSREISARLCPSRLD